MARTGKFKCSACGRTFSMAAHLGRHRTTMHGAKGAKVKAKSQVQAGDPARLLDTVQVWRSELAAEQAQLAVQLGALDQLLTTLGGTALKPTAGRALQGRRIRGGHGGAREGSLKFYIDRVLRATRRPMRRAEVAAADRLWSGRADLRIQCPTSDLTVQHECRPARQGVAQAPTSGARCMDRSREPELQGGYPESVPEQEQNNRADDVQRPALIRVP